MADDKERIIAEGIANCLRALMQPTDRTFEPPSTPSEGTRQARCTLTDAERQALEIAVEYVGSAYAVEHHAQTLRGLLERTK